VSIATSDTAPAANQGAIIGGAVGGGILCLILMGGLLVCLFKRSQRPKAVNDVPLANNSDSEHYSHLPAPPPLANSNSDRYSHLPVAPAPTLYANGNVNV